MDERLYYAHSKGTDQKDWQLLFANDKPSHLTGVAEAAAEYADEFDSRDWGFLAGLWHDLGKYDDRFQLRLADDSISVDHKTAGAKLAVAVEKDRGAGMLLAAVIAGHHGGLANWTAGEAGEKSLKQQLHDSGVKLDELRSRTPEDIWQRTLPPVPEQLARATGPCRLTFWLRFLFSCLVDADFLDTEEFYSPGLRSGHTADFASITTLRQSLDKHVDGLATESKAAVVVNEARREVLQACRHAAERERGIFSLTAATGSGKTLAAMSFALRHAERHGLRRVIAVAPFTSIIDQNAGVYRQALDPGNVIEHHSNLDPETETKRNRFASENWDAPIIVTTAVQFFESLFANRTSRCRKLHNIVRSVILLDEAQTLPAGFLLAILEALRELTGNYGCSIVLSTATQPALKARPAMPRGLQDVTEIISDPCRLAERLRRVDVAWPEVTGQPVVWSDLAGELAGYGQVLAVVHRRQDARELAELLPGGGRFHLSALMCARHRLDVLDRIKQTLKNKGPCRLVSTQLVEAGVDIDFPVVYRALGGLDSIAQAAGRCNREGRLTGRGRVVVFRAPTAPPPGRPRMGLETTESLLRQYGGALDLANPDLFQEYFRMLYAKENPDQKGIIAHESQLEFATVAQKFQLIEDGFSRPVVVPYGDSKTRVDALRQEWEKPTGQKPMRDLQRRLQPFLVNIPVWVHDRWVREGILETLAESVFVLAEPYEHLYHEEFGLIVSDDPVANPERLIQ